MKSKDHPITTHPLFGKLPVELSENLRTLNPWWEGKPGPVTPPRRRWPFDRLVRMLRSGMTPAAVLRGPRRVGKTVLLRQIMDSLIAEGVSPNRILYVPFDELPAFRGLEEPVLAIARWFESKILGRSFNEAGRDNQPTYLFLDMELRLKRRRSSSKICLCDHALRASWLQEIVPLDPTELRAHSHLTDLAGHLAESTLGCNPGRRPDR